MKLRLKGREVVRTLFIFSAVLFFTICFATPLFALGIKTTAPDFNLTTLEGKTVSLRDYQGKIVILKLGTTWCPGCRDQDKELMKIDGFIKETGITLIQVFLDDPVSEIRAYQLKHPMQSPVVTLLGNERLIRDYNVYAIPRLIILSKEQKILSDSTGLTGNQIKARILQKE